MLIYSWFLVNLIGIVVGFVRFENVKIFKCIKLEEKYYLLVKT